MTMNGRQRCGHGIVSHESGGTLGKKIAKVAVGKSKLAEGYARPFPGRPGYRRCSTVASASSRRGGKRVIAVSPAPAADSSNVCSTGGLNHAGSAAAGGAGAGT